MKSSSLIRTASTALAALAVTLSLAQGTGGGAPGDDFGFSQSRPRLVVLLHGVTPKPDQEPEVKIGQAAHARYYWGFQFIKGLQGRTQEKELRVITPKINGTMRIVAAEEEDWHEATTDSTIWDYAPICFPQSWLNVPAGMQNNQQFIKDYIRLTTNSNQTMVMVNTRDGSRHLMPQLKEAINEIWSSYTITFGHLPESQQPQIYLVGHSFGGIIARALLANPTDPDLWGNTLSALDRERANFLRRRVVLVKTLASPHEGTFMPDVSGDIATYIETTGYNTIYILLSAHPFSPYKGMSASVVKGITEAFIKKALDKVSGKRDSLDDLMRMREYNRHILHPDTARRANGGSLVPIYTAAGRNPGGTHYDKSRSVFLFGGGTWNPFSSIDLIYGGTRRSFEASVLYLINGLMHYDGFGHEPKAPWGYAEHPEGDRVSSPWKGLGANIAREFSATWTPTSNTILGILDGFMKGKPYEFGKADGEWDSDGFLGWDSAHAYHIPNNNFYRVFDQNLYGTMLPWDNDNHGSIMFNPGVGLWIHNELVRDAGPWIYDLAARRSQWHLLDAPELPSNGVKLEIRELNNWRKDLDTFSGADYRISVRIGAQHFVRNLPDNQDVVKDLEPFIVRNFRGQVIPIRIDLIDRDTPDPDDQAIVSPIPGQSSMFLYLDTRTGRITGDVNAEEGNTFTSKPIWWNSDHRVRSKIRITRI
jgi:hypothetical protein